MFNIGPLELMVILLLALVVVGPSRLPEVGRSIGKGLRELRKVQDEVRDSINFNLDAEPAPPRPTPRPRAPRPAAADDDEPGTPATPIEPEATGSDADVDASPSVPVPTDADATLGPAAATDGSANGPVNGPAPSEPAQE
jgi:sec-independent protein translocase protein TatA